MANTPFNTSGFIISYPPVAASAAVDITGYYDEVVTIAQPSSSLININGASICLFTSSISVSNTSDTVFVEIADGQDLVTTLTAITTAFNASSSVPPYDGAWYIPEWGPLVATDDGLSILTITAPLNDPNGNNYTISGNKFDGNVLNAISGQFAGFTVFDDGSTITSFIDYSGTELATTTNWILNTGTIIPLYHSYIEISAGTLLLYPLSTAIPQI